MPSYEVYANRIPGSFDVEVFLLQQPGPQYGSVGNYLQFDDQGRVTMTQIVRTGSHEDVKPAFKVREDVWRAILAAFADHAHQQGMENKTETFAKGKLDAIERHLEDMRTLVFKTNG